MVYRRLQKYRENHEPIRQGIFPKNIFPNENCGCCKWILFAMSSILNEASCNVP